MKILLGAASRDYDWVNEAVATFTWLSHSGPINTVIATQIRDSTYLDFSRNQLIQDAKEIDADYLFMLDSDVYLEEFDKGLNYMIGQAQAHEAGVYSGIYVSAMNNEKSISAYTLVDGTYKPIKKWPNTIREVDAVGGGFLLISKKVLDTFPLPYNIVGPFDRFVHLGEDISFSNRVATKGFKIVIDPFIKLGHKKPKGLNRVTFEQEK